MPSPAHKLVHRTILHLNIHNIVEKTPKTSFTWSKGFADLL
jgi:hypothetical protein